MDMVCDDWLEDVGKPKAEVVAKRVMERVAGVEIVPHFYRIEDKELDFYNDFSIIVLGLDSIEARRFIAGKVLIQMTLSICSGFI
ncbi:NEDD8-activating enzyme E1 catalytic subunit [Sarracenia purpurea var. burkii]